MAAKKSPFTTAARVASAATLPPFLKASQKATAVIPSRMLSPALSTMGAVVGGMSRVPFGATAGAAGGAALGTTLKEMRPEHLLEKLTSDPDFLSLSDQEQDAMYEELSQHRSVSNAPLRDAGVAGALTLGGAGLAKAAGTAVKGVRGLPFHLSKSNRLNLANESRSALMGATKGAGETLEQSLSQVPGTVDMSQEIRQLSAAMQTNPEVASLVNQGIEKAGRMGDTVLAEALTSPHAVSPFSAQQIQQILATLKQSRQVSGSLMRAGRMEGQGGKFLTQTSDSVMDVLGHENAMLEKASQSLPESFGQAREAFKTVARGQRELTPYFSKARLIPNMSSGFPEEIQQTVQQVLPAKIARKVLAPAVTKRIGKAVGKGVVATGATAAVLKFLTGKDPSRRGQ